ncbi:MAG: histidine phosphatase family protein [Alphaproteobacteria bacterium]|nr:histidine phosphatase family protein [Alphaproteobacteria bacterium]
MLLARPFVFVRHGETDYNRAGRIQGQRDVPLNDRGLVQAAAARDTLDGLPFTTLCCSPLLRARQTADVINATLGLPLVVIDSLKECGLGELEGRVIERTAWRDPWRDGMTPSGAETYDDFLSRALAGLNQALARPGPVLIVAHGGVFWSVERHAGITLGEDLDNGDVIRLDPPDAATPWRATRVE